MNTIAHIFEPPHSIFMRKINGIEESLSKIQRGNDDINITLNILKDSNQEIIQLFKSNL